MHDTQDEANQIDRVVVESPEMLGKECECCFRILAYKFFKRDTSFRDGHRNRCSECENAPRLSLDEHTARLRERNLSSHGVKAQRTANQDEYRKDDARVGRRMHHTDFIRKIKKYAPNLYVTEGRVVGDLALFLTAPGPQANWENQDFKYLTYIHEGVSNEFSTYEFNNERDILIREKWFGGRGWRTVLLTLIKKGLITEEQANAEFGRAVGEGAFIYNQKLWQYRNATNA